MGIDSIIYSGNSHHICQDYALHFNMEGISCLITSDGCSSSNNTDVGARLLALAANKVLTSRNGAGINILSMWNTDNFKEYLIDKILNKVIIISSFINLDIPSFDATLIITIWDSNIKKGVSFIFGDGIVIYKVNNQLCYISVEYDSNAPYYLSYKLDPERDKKYKEEFKDSKIIVTTNCNNEVNVTFDKFINHITEPFESTERYKLNMIGSASDGLHSFEKDKQSVNMTDIIYPFFDFKNTNGEYLKRRADKYLKQLHKDGYSHYDDISIATLLIKD